MAHPGALILVNSGLQLHHAELGAYPQPDVTLGADLQLDMVVKNLMYHG